MKQKADGSPQNAVASVWKSVFDDRAAIHINNTGVKRRDPLK